MTCIDSGSQTEFEFFQQLSRDIDNNTCAGPKTCIGFTLPSLDLIKVLFFQTTSDPDFIDTLNPTMLDSSCVVLSMCAKHWIIKALEFSIISEKFEGTELITELSFFIFKLTCLSNDWDYKEVTNYTKNLITEGS